MSKELAKPEENSLRKILASDTFKEQIALALPSHCTADRFARVALTALNKTPKLLECTRESVLSCMMTCSQLGIEPDGIHAFLIPYKNDCTLIIGYRGLINLARRSGEVVIFRAELVREKDFFQWENGAVTHRVEWRQPRGEIQCVYSYVRMKDGTEDYEVMTLEECLAIRDRSQGYRAAKQYDKSHPWISDEGEMLKKTVIRRHSKRLTLSPEFHDALDKDGDRIDERPMRNVTPAPPVPNILQAPVVEEPKLDPSPAAAFWAWCESKEFATSAVYKWLIANNHVGSINDELDDAEVEKINRDELNADMS